MSKKILIKDVALAAGVSSALVSYVLNEKHLDRISKETALKIKESANKLGYQPNHIAKSLKTRKTNTIGLMLGDIINPFSHQIARIIEDEARKHDYVVISGSCDEDEKQSSKLMHALVNRQVDGFIIAAAYQTEGQLRHLLQLGIPFILIDRYFPKEPFDYITIDNFNAAHTAVNHLIQKGRKKIAIINYHTELTHLKERKRGYLAAIQHEGEQILPKFICEMSIKDSPETIRSIILNFIRDRPLDAIFAATNSLGIETLKQLNYLDLRVPEDIAVVCFDETDAVDLFYAKLTYIKQPMQQIGHTAVHKLLEKINSAKETETPNQIILKSELIINRSSG